MRRTDQKLSIARIKCPQEKLKASNHSSPPSWSSSELARPPGKKWNPCDPFLAQIRHPSQKPRTQKEESFSSHLAINWKRTDRCFIEISWQTCGDISCPYSILSYFPSQNKTRDQQKKVLNLGHLLSYPSRQVQTNQGESSLSPLTTNPHLPLVCGYHLTSPDNAIIAAGRTRWSQGQQFILDHMTSRGSFQPQPFCNSEIIHWSEASPPT